MKVKRLTKKKFNVVASPVSRRDEMPIRRLQKGKSEISVDTGQRYSNGRKIYRRERITGNEKDAKRKERNMQEQILQELQQLKEQQHPQQKNSKNTPSFQELAERWLSMQESLKKESTLRRYRQILNNEILPIFGKMQIDEITPDHVEDFYYNPEKKGKALHNHKSIINTVMEQAKKKKYISGEHYRNIAEIPIPSWESKEVNCLKDDKDIADLLFQLWLLESVLFVPTYIATATGGRRGEICMLQWIHIDFDNLIITFIKMNTKNKETRTVKITEVEGDMLREVKEYRNASDHDYVCINSLGNPTNPETLSSNFRKMARKLGYNINFHSLRHSHNVILQYNGLTRRYIQEKMGWKDSRMLDRYSHIIEDREDPVAAEAIQNITSKLKSKIDTNSDTNKENGPPKGEPNSDM